MPLCHLPHPVQAESTMSRLLHFHYIYDNNHHHRYSAYQCTDIIPQHIDPPSPIPSSPNTYPNNPHSTHTPHRTQSNNTASPDKQQDIPSLCFVSVSAVVGRLGIAFRLEGGNSLAVGDVRSSVVGRVAGIEAVVGVHKFVADTAARLDYSNFAPPW